jgi:hypothetical protein
MNIVIPMAGKSSRFFEAGFTVPKFLLPLSPSEGSKTMIEGAVDSLQMVGNLIFIVQRDHCMFNIDTFLKEKYPSAEAVEWKDKLGYFKASFELDHARLAAQFSAKGEWLQTECVIDEGDLPEAVLDGWQKSRYAHRVLVEAAKILLPEGGVQYRLLVKKNDFEKKLLFFDSSERLQKEQPSL